MNGVIKLASIYVFFVCGCIVIENIWLSLQHTIVFLSHRRTSEIMYYLEKMIIDTAYMTSIFGYDIY